MIARTTAVRLASERPYIRSALLSAQKGLLHHVVDQSYTVYLHIEYHWSSIFFAGPNVIPIRMEVNLR
jgi:hypothetical protein